MRQTRILCLKDVPLPTTFYLLCFLSFFADLGCVVCVFGKKSAVQRDVFKGAKVRGKQAKAFRINFAVLNFKTLSYVVKFLTHSTVALTSRFTLQVGLPVSRMLSRAS